MNNGTGSKLNLQFLSGAVDRGLLPWLLVSVIAQQQGHLADFCGHEAVCTRLACTCNWQANHSFWRSPAACVLMSHLFYTCACRMTIAWES